MIYWFTDLLTCQLIGWVFDWLIDWFVHWLIDWLTRLSNVSSQSGADSISSSRQSHHSSNSSLGDRSADLFVSNDAILLRPEESFYWNKKGHFIMTIEDILLRPLCWYKRNHLSWQKRPFYWNKRGHCIEIREAILLRR